MLNSILILITSMRAPRKGSAQPFLCLSVHSCIPQQPLKPTPKRILCKVPKGDPLPSKRARLPSGNLRSSLPASFSTHHTERDKGSQDITHPQTYQGHRRICQTHSAQNKTDPRGSKGCGLRASCQSCRKTELWLPREKK